MNAVTSVTGRAAAIRRSNIDTDQIIPASWMKRVERTGYEDGLFGIWREDPEFVLNQPGRDKVSIIIAGPNFGCGSSRQHAVWALRDFGIRAVISPSIADIHRANLPQEGIVPVEVGQDLADLLMQATEEDSKADIGIDVVNRTITCKSAGVISEPFQIDDALHYNLVNGFDPINLTLTLSQSISHYEALRDPWLPRCRPEISLATLTKDS